MLDNSQLGLGDPTLGSSSSSNSQILFKASSRHFFCNDAEGWGPTSSVRSDLTPCFQEIGITSVAVFGLSFGAGTIFLLTKNAAQPVKKNWHFYAKLVVLSGVIATTAAQIALETHAGVGISDVRFWSPILALMSLGTIFAVQFLEHWRSKHPNGVVLFYWLLLIIAYGIKLQSLAVRKVYENNIVYFSVFTSTLGLALLEFVLEYLVPKNQTDYNLVEDGSPYESADIFAVLTFSWLTPLMKYGYKHYLTQDDLWDLRHQDTTHVTGNELAEQWEKEVATKRSPSLWLALFKTFQGPYIWGIILKCASDIFSFIQPQLLRVLIAFIDSYRTDSPESPIRGVAIALSMFLVSTLQSVLVHQHFQRAFDTGMRVKSSLTAIIYTKALKLSTEGRSSKTTGDIVNHMAVDQQRISDLASSGAQLISGPFQIILCLISLYQLIGPSMFAGVGVMLIMIPLNSAITRSMKRLQVTQMQTKDARTRLMIGIINNMKSIKLYAWGSAFMAKLNHIRNDLELKNLRKFGVMQAFAYFAWNLAPFLVSCGTFSIFALTSGRPLTTDIVFPSLTLFNLLAFPLAVLPMTITATVEAGVAVKRLTGYLTAEELQSDSVDFKKIVEVPGDESLRISGGSFTWNRYQGAEAQVLKDIYFKARKGELTCIVGRVGSGKSSLLQAFLGDLWKASGQVTVRGQIAYVAQTPWVMNTTVKENIVFGHRWDPDFYNLTLEACALQDDLKALPDGDKTEVGEQGISLSGGQKARLTLARAVYARADVYLLDDILSAVDQHVGRHLINRVLGKDGILKTKTRVLATNTLNVLKEADFVTLVANKTLIESGTYPQLLAVDGEVAKLLRTGTNHENKKTDSGSNTPASSNKTDPESLDAEGSVPTPFPIASCAATRRTSTVTLRRASIATWRGPTRNLVDEENGKLKTKKIEEVSAKGKVKWAVYWEYAKESTIIGVLVYFISILAVQTGQVGSSFWLKKWSESGDSKGSPSVGYFIEIYFALGMGSAALVIVQNLVLWIFCAIEASRKLHQRMAISIFRSPMSFFETTTSGQILNRFSSDIYRLDEVLARAFNTLFNNLSRLLFTTIVISISTPAFLLFVVPLSWVYNMYQKYYLRTSRELKRLDSVTKSPIFAHFQETLNGASTIRAYRQQNKFSLENEWYMDANLRAYFASISANRWLGVRLEFIGSIVILAAAGLSIINVTTITNSPLSASMVGLAMSYALQITQFLNSLVRQTVEVETNIISVERVLEYANLPSEAPEVIESKRPASSWPADGAVSFEDFSTRYREGLDLVLKGINLEIKPHEKIGVVGRTGAGKSSLTLALFRLIEPAGGKISIDGLDVSTIGLQDLRSRLAIIPQDSAVFQGTVRDNIDPHNVHDDTDLWRVLEYSRLKEYISQLDGKLDAKIEEGGSNLSQGQRQLLSLARALLTSSNILILDEATAAVDVETDAALQQTLRSDLFKNRTIITIAHRINTIIDSDRILVLDKGEVVEFDTPAKLLGDRAEFYELVKEAGLLDDRPSLLQ
ncbi:hypothetical protein EYZ11_007134 [Aspergillus tanneri]|uniref:Uncharacterized protein n=1 Tax=Aspergillus tanneri TaxID=1220188 RepID=A0A4S3JFY7_9EURO|nr:hypothetical protein EYZ11_007134 [Aspergillus tanneri]